VAAAFPSLFFLFVNGAFKSTTASFSQILGKMSPLAQNPLARPFFGVFLCSIWILILAVISPFIISTAAAASFTVGKDEFVWASGSNITEDLGSYGVMGIASPTNLPPARYLLFSARALSPPDSRQSVLPVLGHRVRVLIYGGANNAARFADLWGYTEDDEWVFLNGTSTQDFAGVYGTKTIPSALNQPPAMSEGGLAFVSSGNVLFWGGQIPGAMKINVLLHFNSVNGIWTWVKGIFLFCAIEFADS